jgi:tetratricopeptide (TPR) repeat protein
MPKVDIPGYFLLWWNLDWHARDYRATLDRLAAAPEGVFGLDAWMKANIAGTCYWLLDQPDRARASHEAALVMLEERAKEAPQDHEIHMGLGWAYAGLGLKTEAIREARHAVDLLPVSKDAYIGTYPVGALALVYARVGEHETAIGRLEYLLSIPSETTVWTLRLNPLWDPLRDHPRFKKLVGEDWQAEASP